MTGLGPYHIRSSTVYARLLVIYIRLLTIISRLDEKHSVNPNYVSTMFNCLTSPSIYDCCLTDSWSIMAHLERQRLEQSQRNWDQQNWEEFHKCVLGFFTLCLIGVCIWLGCSVVSKLMGWCLRRIGGGAKRTMWLSWWRLSLSRCWGLLERWCWWFLESIIVLRSHINKG